MISNLIDKVKHQFSRDKGLSSALYDIMGFYPHHIDIYREALSHKSRFVSSQSRRQPGKIGDNERLEFLGDAVLEAVVSDILYHRYTRKHEGFLTNLRSKIVQRTSLNHLADEMGLNRLIQTNKHLDLHHNNVGGNAFEALIGAIYLDRGYARCKDFVENRILGHLLSLEGVEKKEVNFKSKLIEWAQKNRIRWTFQDADPIEGATSGEQVFRSKIVLEGIVVGMGTGRNKKESQQAAARDALLAMRRKASLTDSVFHAKEERTAMEAAPIVALPAISDADAKVSEASTENAKAKKSTSGRSRRKTAPQTAQATPAPKAQAENPDKEAPQKVAAPAQTPEKASAETDKPQAEQAKPRNRRRGTRRKASTDKSSREEIIAAAEAAANGVAEQ